MGGSPSTLDARLQRSVARDTFLICQVILQDCAIKRYITLEWPLVEI